MTLAKEDKQTFISGISSDLGETLNTKGTGWIFLRERLQARPLSIAMRNLSPYWAALLSPSLSAAGNADRLFWLNLKTSPGRQLRHTEQGWSASWQKTQHANYLRGEDNARTFGMIPQVKTQRRKSMKRPHAFICVSAGITESEGDWRCICSENLELWIREKKSSSLHWLKATI